MKALSFQRAAGVLFVKDKSRSSGKQVSGKGMLQGLEGFLQVIGPSLHTGSSGLAKGKRWRIVYKVLKVWSQVRSSGCR